MAIPADHMEAYIASVSSLFIIIFFAAFISHMILYPGYLSKQVRYRVLSLEWDRKEKRQ